MSKQCTDVFEFIKREETSYRAPVRLNDSWEWSMYDHIKTTENYLHSQLNTGRDDYKPFKNIIRPILNLAHRTEDLEVKDVQIYTEEEEHQHLSFLVKKYHDDVFVVENNLDAFFDKLNVSRIDYGGGLSKKLKQPIPEVISLRKIAFCDQRDLLRSPFALLHEFSPDELFEMEKRGWGSKENGATHTVAELVTLWREEEKPSSGIKIYEVHGNLPKHFREPGYSTYSEEYERQMFIVAFYQPKETGDKVGVTLYAAKEEENPFKLVLRDEIDGRALGFGGAEELFEAQVWVNYDMIRMQKMLDAAAVVVLASSDPTIAAKHPSGLKNLKNLEVVDEATPGALRQVDTFPRNLRLFESSVVSWENHAKDMGSAQDPIQGKEPSAGTPFSSLAEQVRQGMGLHEYRRGQFAKHVEEIYHDWLIPHIKKEIVKGHKFLSELTMDELQYVAEKMANSAWEKHAKESVMNGQGVEEGEEESFIQDYKDSLKKKGNKHFVEILKGEFKDTSLAVKVSVASKSRDLAQMTEKIVNIWRFIIGNPQGFAQIMQVPGMAKSFNEILEFSDMSPVDFSGLEKMMQAVQPPTPATPMQITAPVA